jgi:hypothetical protein
MKTLRLRKEDSVSKLTRLKKFAEITGKNDFLPKLHVNMSDAG